MAETPMPIYEYRCTACAAEMEKLQKIADAPLVECPECGQPALVKLVSASSFRLKGSGWYETDFKTGNKKNGVAGSGADTTSTEATKVAATDSKPASAESGSSPAGTTSSAA